MELEGIRELIASADPDARHDYTMSDDADFTVWSETEPISEFYDDRREQVGWRFTVHRLERLRDDDEEETPDSIVDALREMFDETDGITYTYRREPVPSADVVHHIFDCEAI